MKTKTILTLSVGILLFFVYGNVSAQDKSTTGETNLTAGPQAVTNHAVSNPDVLVITGKIVDAASEKPIGNAKINFDRFGEELIQASVDKAGNYAIALNKKELGEPVRLIFKVAGYKRYVVKNIDKNATYLDADIFLQPMESDEKSNASIKYIMNDDPFNTMVIKMQ